MRRVSTADGRGRDTRRQRHVWEERGFVSGFDTAYRKLPSSLQMRAVETYYWPTSAIDCLHQSVAVGERELLPTKAFGLESRGPFVFTRV